MALRQALFLDEDRDMQRIMVACDNLCLINKIKESKLDKSPTGAIGHDIKNWATKFISCNFIYINRSCNVVAYTLGK